MLCCIISSPCFYRASLNQPSLHKAFHSEARCSCLLSNPQHTTRTEIVNFGGRFCRQWHKGSHFQTSQPAKNQKVCQRHSLQGLGIQCLTRGPDSSMSPGPLIKSQSLAAPAATLLLLWKVQRDPVKTATREEQPKSRQLRQLTHACQLAFC